MNDDTTPVPWSPQWVRSIRFPHRRNGYALAEVEAFMEDLAAHMQRQRDVEASLRSEIARLEATVASDEVQSRSVDLFSQAQLVADQLIAEAVQQAQDLMSAARAQEREILGRAGGAAGSAASASGYRPSATGGSGGDVAYVNTYAKIVAVQLRSVVEALSEQVDKLTEIPDQQAPSIDGWGQSAEAGRSGSQSRFGAATPLEADRGPDDSEPLIWASMMPPPAREPGW